jgi:hypothetical protein
MPQLRQRNLGPGVRSPVVVSYQSISRQRNSRIRSWLPVIASRILSLGLEQTVPYKFSSFRSL